MRKVLLPLILLSGWLFAAELHVAQGSVTAHTEVFGDSTIDPSTTALASALTVQDGVASMRGSITVSLVSLASDNKDRDEHMHETLASAEFPNAVYTVENVVKNDNGYQVDGTLTLHGITKPLSLQAELNETENAVAMKGTSMLLMTDFGIEPPKLLFLTVRNQVDILFDVTFDKR